MYICGLAFLCEGSPYVRSLVRPMLTITWASIHKETTWSFPWFQRTFDELMVESLGYLDWRITEPYIRVVAYFIICKPLQQPTLPTWMERYSRIKLNRRVWNASFGWELTLWYTRFWEISSNKPRQCSKKKSLPESDQRTSFNVNAIVRRWKEPAASCTYVS